MKESESLLREFKSGLGAHISGCLESIESKVEIAGIGLFTDSDMSGFKLCINSQEHLKNQNEIAESENDLLVNKWWIPEWWWESNNQEEESKLFGLLDAISEALEFAIYKRTLFKVYCQVLKENAKQIASRNSNIVFLVQESDNFDQDLHREGLLLLLSDEQWEEYVRFNRYWSDV